MHFDSFGLRDIKYQRLQGDSLSSVKWTKITPQSPYWFFVPNNKKGYEEYECGFKITDLFTENGNGIKFRKDNLLIKHMHSTNDVLQMLHDINNLTNSQVYAKYKFEPTPDWNLENKRRFF